MGMNVCPCAMSALSVFSSAAERQLAKKACAARSVYTAAAPVWGQHSTAEATSMGLCRIAGQHRERCCPQAGQLAAAGMAVLQGSSALRGPTQTQGLLMAYMHVLK